MSVEQHETVQFKNKRMAKKKRNTGRWGLSFNDRYSPRDRRAIGIGVIALGIFSFVLAANLFYLNRQFDGPTVKVIGSVEGLYHGGNRSNPRVAYRYLVGTTEVHDVTPIDGEIFSGLQLGEPLPIKYLPNNPAKNRIDLPAENAERHNTVYGLTAMSFIFMCVGALVFRIAQRDIKSGKITKKCRDLNFIPDPNNRKEVRAQGWNSEDFAKILIDFRKVYDDSLENDIAAKIHSEKDGSLLVTFPQDVPDQLFAFLINYAQYPKGIEPKAGSILVVGKATISGNFEGNFQKKLIGMEGIFYVPAGDREYDVVYVQVGEETFAHSFAFLNRWKKVADPRLPADFANILSVRS
jgi:hypothetical protein